jgi:hypothetical protein
MSWVILDDRFPNHPKIVKAGGDAAWLFVASLCHANDQLTDGVILAAIVPRLTDRRQPMKLAAKLVEVGLWERVGADYRIHDYHEFYEAAETVRAKKLAEIAVKVAAGRIGGLRSGEVRKAKQTASRIEAEREAESKQNRSVAASETQAKAKPDTNADTNAEEKQKPLSRVTPAGEDRVSESPPRQQSADALFAAAWQAGTDEATGSPKSAGNPGDNTAAWGLCVEHATLRGVDPAEFAPRIVVAYCAELAASASQSARSHPSPRVDKFVTDDWFNRALARLDGKAKPSPASDLPAYYKPADPRFADEKGPP